MRTLKHFPRNKKMSFADLEEIFNVKQETIRYRLNKGLTLKEAIDIPINDYMNDLTGKRFNRLFAEYRIPGSHIESCKYHCICDCGNECDVLYGNLVSGRQQSCGCLNMEKRHERFIDLSGKIINGVQVLYRIEDEIAPNGTHHIQYRCICPFCGEEFEARGANIKSGNTGGCGCTRNQYTHHIDLVGMDFEFCHVNKRLPNQIQPSGGSRVMYECTCICGNVYSDWAHTIMHGRSNCGCVHFVSMGEETIKKWLIEKEIQFATGYWFSDLRGKRNMPYYFDFALFDKDYNLLCLIEYQGKQHYCELKHSIRDFGKTQREISDPAKRKYCATNNIKLFEIAYNEDAIEKCENIYKLLYYDNTVPSSQETA